MRLAHKLVGGVLFLALLIWIMAYHGFRVSREVLEGSIAASTVKVASEALDEVDKAIYDRVQEWKVYASSPLLQESLRASNRRFEAMPDAAAYIEAADREWVAAAPDAPTPLMLDIGGAALSRELAARLTALERQQGYRVYGEVFITNRFGVNVAQSSRTTDFRQDDEEWWQLARDAHVHVGDVEYDRSAAVFSTDICVRVEDAGGNFLGVIKAVLDTREVQEILDARASSPRSGTQHVLSLFSRDHKLIHSSDRARGSSPRPSACLAQAVAADTVGHLRCLDADRDGEYEVLAAQARSQGYRDFEGLGWVLLAETDVDQALMPVTDLRRKTLLSALGVAIIGAALGLGFAASLSRRIAALGYATLEIGRGNLDVQLRPRQSDELGELALRFNSMARELKGARAAAESADRAKTQFLANMSHEIRTPMTVILGSADLLREAQTTADREENIRTIQQHAHHLLALISDILDLSRIEAGEIQLESVPASPFELVAEAILLMRDAATSKELSLEAQFEGPLPERIHTDPTRVRQILLNLVHNAIKFTSTGEVRLVTRLVDASGAAPLLCFEVSDTGVGIDAEQAKSLFRPFSQGDASTTRRFGGTGLGLAICRQMSELLGGGISVSSEPGVGSTFRVSIATGPLEDVRLVEHPEDASWPSQGCETENPVESVKLSGRVLVVEDDAQIQRLIRTILTHAGAEVMIAENGEIGVELALAEQAEGRPFDLILMDQMMPVLDGYEATRSLRGAGYDGVIVALTADAMQTTRERCLVGGCNGFVTKPVSREALLETVREYLAKSVAT